MDFDRDVDRGLLIKLLDSFGAPHPQLDVTHYSGDIGKCCLKWEQHTEFSTYTLFWVGLSERPFYPAEFEAYPPNWVSEIKHLRITSIILRVEQHVNDENISQKV